MKPKHNFSYSIVYNNECKKVNTNLDYYRDILLSHYGYRNIKKESMALLIFNKKLAINNCVGLSLNCLC